MIVELILTGMQSNKSRSSELRSWNEAHFANKIR